MSKSTIFALSSGSLPSGVAVVRISGSRALEVAAQLSGNACISRSMKLETFRHPVSNEILDRGLLLCFPGPASFTGENVAEFHCHGGSATVSALLDVLADQEGCRLAEPGEFSRQAFENGKMDLTELEGLADLISAQTEAQRKLALAQSGGSLRDLYGGWRRDLIRSRALIEAELDFSDEDDVPGSVSHQVWEAVSALLHSIANHLDDNQSGEIIRDGYKIALMGHPNAGKSSLLNALAKRDVAIVTDEPGTTRDVISVDLDLDGTLVIVSDTAGLRDTDSTIELEGMRRAGLVASEADLVLWLQAIDDNTKQLMPEGALLVTSKSDLAVADDVGLNQENLVLSTTHPNGLDSLLSVLKQQLASYTTVTEQPLISRKRHRAGLKATTTHLDSSLKSGLDIELRSENLRLAADELGRITGRIDVEDLLDVIFSEFCIGK